MVFSLTRCFAYLTCQPTPAPKSKKATPRKVAVLPPYEQQKIVHIRTLFVPFFQEELQSFKFLPNDPTGIISAYALDDDRAGELLKKRSLWLEKLDSRILHLSCSGHDIHTKMLKTITKRLPNLQTIDLSNCRQLEDVTPLTQLTNLKEVRLVGSKAEKREDIPKDIYTLVVNKNVKVISGTPRMEEPGILGLAIIVCTNESDELSFLNWEDTRIVQAVNTGSWNATDLKQVKILKKANAHAQLLYTKMLSQMSP